MSDFSNQFGTLLEGFTQRDPLLVPLELYRELMAEPEIAHLMPRIAIRNEGERRRIAQCAGKERFASMQAARKVVTRYTSHKNRTKRLHSTEGKRQAYRCDVCSGFHIGAAYKELRK